MRLHEAQYLCLEVLVVRKSRTAKGLEFVISIVVSELYFIEINHEDGNSIFKAAREKKGKKIPKW